MDDRTWFRTAAAGLIEVLPGLAGRLDLPGLGSWTVRSLLGHTSRALTTLETYLAKGAESPGAPALGSAADYYRAAAATLADPAQVAERGRQAGLALGDEPLTTVREAVARVVPVLDGTPDDASVATPWGRMTLAGYLPTRAFELTVHTLDLARASDQSPPAATLETLEPTLTLAGTVASPQQRLSLLLAATGREHLDPGFTVL